MKKTKSKPKQAPKPHTDDIGQVIGENDQTISLYIELYTLSLEEASKLIDRIQSNGVPKSIDDFYPSLEMLSNGSIRDWVDDIEDIYGWASLKFQQEYSDRRFQYTGRIYKLADTIRNQAARNQQAGRIAAAISRLMCEVDDATRRAVSNYNDGKGKPKPEEVISDARLGTLWDNLVEAIENTSAPDLKELAEATGKATIDELEKARAKVAKANAKKSEPLKADKRQQIEDTWTEYQKLIDRESLDGKVYGPRTAAKNVLERWKRKKPNTGFLHPHGNGGKPYKDPVGALRKSVERKYEDQIDALRKSVERKYHPLKGGTTRKNVPPRRKHP